MPESQYTHDVIGLVNVQIEKGDYAAAKTWASLKCMHHAVPKWVTILFSIITLIVIETTTYTTECQTRSGLEVTDFGGDDANMGFLTSMLIWAFMMDGIYLILYFFIGLNKLTNLGWAKTLANGSAQYSYLSWWMLELSSHAVLYFLLFIAGCVAAAGIADATEFLEKSAKPGTGSDISCEVDLTELRPFDFCAFMAFFMIVPLGWESYYEYKALKGDHGLPDCPCSKGSRNETVHSV